MLLQLTDTLLTCSQRSNYTYCRYCNGKMRNSLRNSGTFQGSLQNLSAQPLKLRLSLKAPKRNFRTLKYRICGIAAKNIIDVQSSHFFLSKGPSNPNSLPCSSIRASRATSRCPCSEVLRSFSLWLSLQCSSWLVSQLVSGSVAESHQLYGLAISRTPIEHKWKDLPFVSFIDLLFSSSLAYDVIIHCVPPSSPYLLLHQKHSEERVSSRKSSRENKRNNSKKHE